MELDALPPFLTLEEVARLVRLSRSHIGELALSGALPTIQFGSRKCRRVAREDFLGFVKSRRQARPAQK